MKRSGGQKCPSKYKNTLKKGEIMKTFKEISAQIERIERLYYNFGCGTKKMLETAERFFFSQQNVGLCF